MEILAFKGENLAVIFGAKPGVGVEAKTDMVSAVTQSLVTSTDMTTFTVIIPTCFDTIATNDANIELIVSN